MGLKNEDADVGCVVAQLKLTNFPYPSKALLLSALVDTSAAYIALPNAWRDSLGDIEQLTEIGVEMADQSTKRGYLCGPGRRHCRWSPKPL